MREASRSKQRRQAGRARRLFSTQSGRREVKQILKYFIKTVPAGAGVTLRLRYRPPYDWDSMLTCPAGPWNWTLGIKCRNPFRPKTVNIKPRRMRETVKVYLIGLSPSYGCICHNARLSFMCGPLSLRQVTGNARRAARDSEKGLRTDYSNQ